MGGALPKFYEHWLGAENTRPENTAPHDEGSFNCGDCFMVAPRGLTRDLGPFDASLKCCTFHPYLPSFTVGRLLLKNESEAAGESRRVLRGYLEASRLTPLGATPRRETRPTSICETGKHQVTRCAFLSKEGRATCTIRDYRPSTCAAYVCRSSTGVGGLRSWREWEARLVKFESTLAHLVAFELGFLKGECDIEFKDFNQALAFYGRANEVASDIAYIDD